MAVRNEPEQDEKGLAARHLVLVFLAGVAVCAVFFSLGFLVGYNERTSKAAPVTETVTAPPVIPPTVNPPLETAQPAAKESAAISASPARPRAESEAKATAEPGPASKASATSAAPPEAAPRLQVSATNSHTAAATAPPPPQGGEVGMGFTIQVAAVRTKPDAEALVKILKTRGYPVFLVTPEYAHANDNLFRVQVGPFASRDDAEKVRVKLAQEGFKPFVRH